MPALTVASCPVSPVPPALTADCAAAEVPATATTRQLQALAAVGWPPTELAGLGAGDADVLADLTHGRCDWASQATARAVAWLFDRLWLGPGPCQATRRQAERLGWAPGGAWDETTIGDPAAAPEGVRPARISSATRTAMRVEDSEELLLAGLSLEEAADQLGVTPRTLERNRTGRGLRPRTPGLAIDGDVPGPAAAARSGSVASPGTPT